MPPRRLSVIAAFATLYLVWGSTYLGIRIAVTTVPPFLLAGARFAVAGMALMLWRRTKGVAMPTLREWRGSIAVGACLVLLSNVPVVWVEPKVASGIVAVFAAGTPLLIALFNGRRTGIPLGRQRAVGLVLGTAGIILLGSATFRAVHDPIPLMLLGLASVSWAIGSTYGRGWPQPDDHLMASAAQMLAGGSLALLVGVLSGETSGAVVHGITGRSVLAWGYLALFGSLVAYPVFQWLLRVADATSVASYTYVNPVIALLLGILLAHETVTPRMFAAAAILIPAVGLVVTGGPKKGPAAKMWEVKGEA
jgi:drug/metabolite transporter (DMT)-like permease